MALSDLQSGMHLLLADGTTAVVEATAYEYSGEPDAYIVYNFEVSDWHTYFVGDRDTTGDNAAVWVHNMCKPIKGSGGADGGAPSTGRGSNKLAPDPNATGPHTTFRRDGAGNVTTHQEWTPNPKNPTGFDAGKRVDTQYSKPTPHFNKVTKQDVPTPHVHDKSVPGGVRPATPDELPK